MKLRYEKHGDGKPVFLLHAFPLNNEMWRENSESIIENGFKVIVPNLEFDSQNPDSLSETALKIAEIADAENIKKSVFAGISMGGYVCFNLFRLRPELFAGLFLCDTNSSADDEQKRKSRFQTIAKLETDGNRILVESMLPKLLCENTKSDKKEVVEKVEKWILQSNVDSNISALKAMANRKDHDYLLPEIKVPTKIIFGKEDKIMDFKIGEKLHTQIPESELSVIPNAGHLPNIEQPEKFNKELLEFLLKINY